MPSEDKPTALLVYPCYICTQKANERGTYYNASKAITHLKNVHGIVTSERSKGARRPANDNYNYTSDPKKAHDEKHYACPSCWFHCTDIENFHSHMFGEHSPIFAGSTKQSSGFKTEYNGTHYRKQTVNEIEGQLNNLMTKFQELLKM